MVGECAPNVYGYLRRNVVALEVHRVDAAQEIDEHVVEIPVWKRNDVPHDQFSGLRR